jgi:general nucleoside transport system permease protein
VISFLLLAIAYAAPVLFAALGELLCERAGVVNIGLEGLMLVGALTAVVVTVSTGQPVLGVLAALLSSTALGGVFALFAIGLKRDQIIVGTTLNFLALGITGVWFRAWLKTAKTGTAVTLPGWEGWSFLTILALVLVPALHVFLSRTRLGLALRASGEKPEAVAAAGYDVNRLRVAVCLACGALCGLGGATLSVSLSNAFTEEMTGGRGFVALAVVVFGRWKPLGVLGAALLFALADAGQARLQAMGFFKVPYPIFLMLPYVLTLLALAIRGAKARPPAALGEPFEPG